jgi:hypothetical protein
MEIERYNLQYLILIPSLIHAAIGNWGHINA